MGRPLDLYDVASIDPALGASLERLSASLAAWRAAGGKGPLLVDGCPIEDLCLSFTLPGAAPRGPGARTPLCPPGVRRSWCLPLCWTLPGARGHHPCIMPSR